jgi:cell division protein FtsW
MVVLIMMFIGLVPIKQLGKLIGIIAIAGVFVVSMVMMVGHDAEEENNELTKVEQTDQPKKEKSAIEKMFHRADTWKSRIKKFGRPKPSPQDYDLDKDAQVAHANIAIVSSGIIGKGPGKSTERDFLSQAFSDFIYAIIIEELGLLGAAAVAFLYIILLYRCARIASRCENNFPAFLAMGLGLLLVIQAVFNMMVAVGLAPVTGQPLPLISKGGTSTIINCAYIGAILSVSRSAKMRKEENIG